MSAVEFNPEKYPEHILRLVLASAEKWHCSPGEALGRILSTVAKRHGFTPPSQTTDSQPEELSHAA